MVAILPHVRRWQLAWLGARDQLEAELTSHLATLCGLARSPVARSVVCVPSSLLVASVFRGGAFCGARFTAALFPYGTGALITREIAAAHALVTCKIAAAHALVACKIAAAHD
jgi:hypothetical protein